MIESGADERSMTDGAAAADTYTLAARVGQALMQHGMLVATAESCTGGLIAAAMTSVAGSSSWFDRGFVTYSNAAKLEMLGVAPATLEHHGAVSEPTAREMAVGALSKSGAHIAVAVTGIAGPGGGTPAKPVGMVCFGWARRDGRVWTETVHFAGNRDTVRRESVTKALTGLEASLANG